MSLSTAKVSISVTPLKREDEQQIIRENAFNLLFDRSLAYELLAEKYVKYWSTKGNEFTFNSCCEPCKYLVDAEDETHLIQIYYGMLPMTTAVIVDAAVVLLLNRWGSTIAHEKIAQLSPFALSYHFFYNCCFTEKGDMSTTAFKTKLADYLLTIDARYSMTDDVDVKDVGYTLRGFKPPLQKTCGCGKLKQSVVKIKTEERQNDEKGIVFVGRKRGCRSIRENGKKREEINSDNRLKFVQSILKANLPVLESDDDERRKEDDDRPNFNLLKHYHTCNVCDAMYITENYDTFARWDREFVNAFKKLKGANVTTCVDETYKMRGEECHFASLREMIEHAKNATCWYNVRRFIAFFDVFSDMEKVKNTRNMKHITKSFLRYREDLLCCDLLLAIWIDRIMVNKLRVFNEKISAWVTKVYQSHDFWYR